MKRAGEVMIPSSKDGTEQPALLYVPPGAPPADDGQGCPLLVFLHSWSTNYTRSDGMPETLDGCVKRGWVFLSPNFRGPNERPEACASDLAVQDVLDAVAFAKRRARVDERRIYLVGGSGGGHMVLMMAARAPTLWAGVSAWVPITDLADWHRSCRQKKLRYADMMERCCGGPPGTPETDKQYRQRSPLFFLAAAKGLPIDINVGIRDGHAGASVPVSHSLNAFNVLADANGQAGAKLSKQDILAVTRDARIPDHLAGATQAEPGRKHAVLFRRSAGPARVTVFDGGHEIDPPTALQWLADIRRVAEATQPRKG